MTWVNRYKHKKGGIYDVFAEGRVQTSTPLLDMDDVIIYQSINDNSFWVRSPMEFNDGRFTPIAQINTSDPLGYDVLMDLMHKMVEKIRKREDHVPLLDLREQLINMYPEAELLIQKRWGK